MRILWVATKSPWPPIDGGRRLVLDTLEALRDAGCAVTLVAPAARPQEVDGATIHLRSCCRPHLVVAGPRSLAGDWLRARLRRRPLTIVRHARPAVRDRVRALLAGEPYAVVQAEQVQALWAADPAFESGCPVVLRAQNVESDLWSATAQRARWRRPLLAAEARRLAAWEGAAVRRTAATVALSAEDAARLAALAGPEAGARVEVVAAPFAAELPAGEPLAGAPPVIAFGSGGWRPNQAGAEWFRRQVWPRVRAALPGAVLHLFGLGAGGTSGDRSVVGHPAPADSRVAYAAGALMVVPLLVASGVRIKILEAWARGLPVIATPQAARGLGAEDGRELVLARDAEEIVAAIGRLHDQPEKCRALIEAGRQRLRTRHAPERIAAELERLYGRLGRGAGSG